VPWGSAGNFAIGGIDVLPDGHFGRALCSELEWVNWPGIGPALVLGPGTSAYCEGEYARTVTIEWRRMMDRADQEEAARRQQEQAEAERRKDPMQRIADLERRLAGR
jgi:hypothetical protein